MFGAYHIAGGREEDAVAVDARCGAATGHVADGCPAPRAVLDQFFPLFLCGHAPLFAPFHMCYIVVGAGEGRAQLIVLFPGVVELSFLIIGIDPLICFHAVIPFWLDFAVCIEVAVVRRIRGSDIPGRPHHRQAHVDHARLRLYWCVTLFFKGYFRHISHLDSL